MNFKATIPYVIFGLSHVLSASDTAARNPVAPTTPDVKVEIPKINVPKLEFAGMPRLDNPQAIAWENQELLAAKAQELTDGYIDNMLSAQRELHAMLGTRKYAAAIRRALPGAPVGRHCLYGQYTHLKNALRSRGDTLTIIPEMANAACNLFKKQMRNKCHTSEYDGAIREGRMFESDMAYDAALDRYMSRRRIKPNASDSVRAVAMADFAKTNFSADKLSPGTILIVPRFRGSKDLLHAIMYVGRGRVENGRFVADANGRHIYAGHNNENIGDLFNSYDVSNVFVADTKKIAQIEYGKEFDRIQSMPRDELAAYLRKMRPNIGADLVAKMSRHELLQTVRHVYFNIYGPHNDMRAATALTAYNNAGRNQMRVVQNAAAGRTI